MTTGGTVLKVGDLAFTLQVSFDSGAKRVLLPSANGADIQTVPTELFIKFQPVFYGEPVDAVFKALDAD